MAGKINNIPIGKYKIGGSGAFEFNEQWDKIPLTTIAGSIPGFVFKGGNSGKLTAKCPYHNDSKSSAVVLPPTSGPASFHCSVCGTATLFEFYADQKAAIDGKEAVKFACEEFGISSKIKVKSSSTVSSKKSKSKWIDPILSDDFVELMHDALMSNEVAIDYIQYEKGVSKEVLKEFKIGWFDRGFGDKRYVIPIRNLDGKLINYRMYNQKTNPKWIGLDNISDLSIFPHEVNPDSDLSMVIEGEMDVLCARSNGIDAFSGTGGSGTWRKEWSEAFTGHNVAVMYDNDQAGLSGSILVGESISPYASSCKVLRSLSNLPKGDLTDLFVNEKWTTEAILEKVYLAEEFKDENSLLESFTEVVFSDLSSLNTDSRVKTKFKVFQIESQLGLVSSRVMIDCKRGTKKACKECPSEMQDQFIIPSNPQNIDFMQTHQVTSDFSKLKTMLRLNCSDISAKFDNKYNLYKCHINHPESPFTEEKSIDDCIMVTDEHVDIVKPAMFESQIEVGQFPKSGAGKGIKTKTWFLFKPTRVKTDEESFRVDDEYEKLSVFQPEDGKERLKFDDIYEDLESKLAIQDRLDPVIAVDLCFLSVKEISVSSGIFKESIKGVLEVAIFGSSRTGKTKISERLSLMYKSGKIYDCANLSNAALIGMAHGSGKFSPGILPKSDGDLIILDEADKYSEETKFDKLTSTRSSGVAKYNKMDISKSMPARVRIIWVANPPTGKRMDDYKYPFEVFRDVMKRDSSVSRFDFAISVLGKDFIKSKIRDKNRYSLEAYRSLLLFSRSIEPEDVEISSEAGDLINNSSISLFDEFGKDKGPVSNDIEEKLTRISAAIAVRLFSYDLNKRKLIVKEKHAEIAISLMYDFHSDQDVGYDMMHGEEEDLSKRMRDTSMLINIIGKIKEDESRKIFCEAVSENIGRGIFMKDQLFDMIPKSGGISNSDEFFQQLVNSGAIYSVANSSEKNFKTRYRFSDEGKCYIVAIAKLGLNDRKKVEKLVSTMKSDSPEQEELMKAPF